MLAISKPHPTRRPRTGRCSVATRPGTRRCTGGTPLLNPRWRVPTTEQQTAERAVITARQQNLDRNIPILPVMQPLAVGDVVLMRTARSLLAVDFTTGKRIWEVRSQSDLQSDRVAAAGARIAAMQGVVGDPSLSEKLWENATTGTLASDGLFIFAVEDPGNGMASPNEPAAVYRAAQRSGAGHRRPAHQRIGGVRTADAGEIAMESWRR